MSTCGKGGGGTSQNVGGIYSAGKCADFPICVRTQIDFYLECGITAYSDNKTRLKRLICVHIGHHAHKQDGTAQYYHALLAKIAQNRVKCAIFAKCTCNIVRVPPCLRVYCPICTQIKRFKRVLLFGCAVTPHSR